MGKTPKPNPMRDFEDLFFYSILVEVVQVLPEGIKNSSRKNLFYSLLSLHSGSPLVC